MNIEVEVSFGEFLDKIKILEIKSERIKDADKLVNINKELKLLSTTWEDNPKSKIDISEELKNLKSINEKLWVIEDDIRDKERNKNFDQQFIELARAVYFSNDERARIKRIINKKLGSNLIEEKSYTDY
ncbi:FIG01218102: hypothetical protein [hydrothermal vent metagenome]|uniref:Uncharacterized protein n=1 Tax=hydrothermal vent metagenome TaxID=652676 RepID=A0A3B1AYV6_9ZZZZ